MRFALALAAVLWSVSPAGAAPGPNAAAVLGNAQMGCGLCHLDRPAAERRTGEIDFAALKRELSGEEGICYSCHNGVVRDSRLAIWEGFQHPCGARPRDAEAVRKSGFPLDAAGRIFCGSCHTPHVKGEGIGEFMRFATGDAFCRRCHLSRGLGRKFGEHVMAGTAGKNTSLIQAAGGKLGPGQVMTCGTCHRAHGANSPFLLVLNPWGSGGLCQTCHGLNPSREGMGPGKTTHPVNARMAGNPLPEWSRETIAISPTGKVDCWSCHRVHATPSESRLLVREIYRGNGCVRCHPQQGSFSGFGGNHPVSMTGQEVRLGQEQVTCLSCHRAHNAYSNSRQLLRYDRTQSRACGECHLAMFTAQVNHPLGILRAGRSGRLGELGAQFGPNRAMLCTTCHRVHQAAENTRGLVAGEKRICLYCHQDKASLGADGMSPGGHPVLVPASGSMSIEVIAAGGRIGAGGELLCTTCHRIHGAGSRDDCLVLDKRTFTCTLCHRSLAGAGKNRHSQATALVSFLEGGGEGAIEEKDACRSCHAAHGWSRTAAEGRQDLISRLCLSCHGEGKPASKPDPATSHPLPSSMSAGRSLATDLPLYLGDGRAFRKGGISCATCHDIHGPDIEGNANYLRKPVSGRDALCSSCHRDKTALAGSKHDLSVTAPAETNIAGVRADAGGLCSPCHLAHGGTGKAQWARLLTGEGEAANLMCRSCHAPGLVGAAAAPGAFSHPTEGLLGGGRGEAAGPETPMTCVTCHEPHRSGPREGTAGKGAGKSAAAAGKFLRRPDAAGAAFCLECHPDKGNIAATAHDLTGAGAKAGTCAPGGKPAGVCAPCHVMHRGRAPLGWPGDLTGEGDAASRICLQCHGAGRCAGDSGTGVNTHPLGVRPAETKNLSLPLFGTGGRAVEGGAVGCASCHQVHGGESSAGSGNAYLRARADGHAPLCADCHRRQAMVGGTDHDLRVTAPASRNMDGKVPADSGVCGVCHKVHQAPYELVLWNRDLGPGTDLSTRLCSTCHFEGGMGKVPARFDVHYQTEFVRDINSPKMPVTLKRAGRTGATPPLPIFSGEGREATHGYITCATCHEPHVWDGDNPAPGQGMPQEGDRGNSFLRTNGSFALQNSLCEDCHPGEAFQKFQEFHFPKGPAAPGQGPIQR